MGQPVLATVLLTYALQNQTGKIILWTTFLVSLILLIPEFKVLSQLTQAVAYTITTSDPGPAQGMLNELQGLRFLGIIPAIGYGIAFLNARIRIENGETLDPNDRRLRDTVS